MNADSADLLGVLLLLTALGLLFGFAALVEKLYMRRQKRRRRLPAPDSRAIGGESHKPWM